MKQSARKNLFFCLFLTILTTAVFWDMRGNDFINYDDFQYVTDNRHVNTGLSIENIVWALKSGYASNWHPVTWISHMVDIELFGLNPQGHHLMSLFLHTANACLLFLFLNKITGAAWRSVVVAALFAIHPLRVESVAWVAERKDVLSTCFALSTLLLYTWYVQKRTTWRYLALFGCFLLGLMSKPMLVTLPIVLLLLDYWPLGRFASLRADGVVQQSGQNAHTLSLSALFIEKIPLLVAVLFSSGITLIVQRAEALHTLEITPLSFRIANALVAYLRYLGKTVWPTDLAVLYPLPQAIPLLQSLGSAILLLLISYCVYVLSRRRPYFMVGWLWFLGTLVPVIGIVQVGLQSIADRYTYFPLIGFFIMIVWGVADLTTHRPTWRIPQAMATVGMLAVLSTVTWSYERCWENSTTLFTHAIEVTSDNYYAHFMLGNAYYKDALFQDALTHYGIVLRLNPRFADAYVNAGIIHAKQGNQPEALKYFTTALALKPGSHSVHYNIAVALQAQGNVEEAVTHYREVLRLDPENIGGHYNMGLALMGLKRWDDAIPYFIEAIRLKPGLEEANQNLQECIRHKGGK